MNNLPPSWPRMSDYQRVGYLCNAHLAPDFRTACQMVNRMRVKAGRKQARASSVPKPVVAGQWYTSHPTMA